MELINATRMQAGYAIGLEPSGRELLVIVVKGTFTLPATGERIGLHPVQAALETGDTFTGEPGRSSTLIEAEFVPRKKRCDVLLYGSAHAPDGRPSARVPVGLRVGHWSKTFAVVGDRVWDAGIAGVRATPAQPFTTKTVSYDVAFGGVDDKHEDPARHAWFMRNPVGRGFHRHLKRDWIDGTPLPNTEELARAVSAPDADYAPMAYGAIGRHWEPRSRFAGTYDANWLDQVFPFLPSDFDERYYQAAPPDQQLPFPVPGLQVVMANLTPDGQRMFELPRFEARLSVVPKNGPREDCTPTLDTIFFEPDEERFTMSWRLARPLRRDIFEVAQVIVGRAAPKLPGVLATMPEFVETQDAAQPSGRAG